MYSVCLTALSACVSFVVYIGKMSPASCCRTPERSICQYIQLVASLKRHFIRNIYYLGLLVGLVRLKPTYICELFYLINQWQGTAIGPLLT